MSKDLTLFVSKLLKFSIAILRLCKPGRKPRTYCQIARKNYLGIVRNKKPGKKTIRKAIGKQLRYVKRNLGAVDRLLVKAVMNTA